MNYRFIYSQVFVDGVSVPLKSIIVYNHLVETYVYNYVIIEL